MYIGKVSEATEELQDALQRLVPQLSVHKIPPTLQELNELIKSASSTLLAARYPDENNAIAGILSLTIYRVPTGIRSIIEDLVVDKKMRRRGIGEALVRNAIELAREAGADGVSLTSNSQREIANQLYQSLGFELRKTNPYFYKIT
jgi:ribosomal protein S18 acetylase RimI-like enzyme